MSNYKYTLKDAKKAFENFIPNIKVKEQTKKKKFILIGFVHGFELMEIKNEQ